jgi:hypothetical protein
LPAAARLRIWRLGVRIPRGALPNPLVSGLVTGALTCVSSLNCDPIATPSAGTPNTAATPCDPHNRCWRCWESDRCEAPSQTALGAVLLFASRPASSRTSPELTGLVAGRLAGRQVQACAAMPGATSLARSRGARFALVWRSSRVARSAGAPACPHTVILPTRPHWPPPTLRARGAYPCHRSSGCLPWSIPSWGQSAAVFAADWAPRGSGAAAPQGALRALD